MDDEKDRSRASRPRLFLAWLVMVVAMANLMPQANSAARIEGELSVFAFPAETNGTPFRRVGFVVERDSVRWSLELTNFVYREGVGPIGKRYSFDGAFVTEESWWPQGERPRDWKLLDARLGGAKPSKPPQKTTSTGFGRFPRNMEPLEAAAWIAFCLPAELARNSTQSIPNIFIRLAWPTNELGCVAELLEGHPTGRISFLKPGRTMVGRPEIVEVDLPAPFQNGYVGFVHEVMGRPSPEGYPLAFRQTHYHVEPPSARKPDPLREASVIVLGSVRAVRQIAAAPIQEPAQADAH